jgi:LmbE family N-acetylglucosaminyl deacetylase
MGDFKGMKKTILAIGAHADDCEIGVGGILLQAAQAGCRVVIVTVVGDFNSWALTQGQAEETKRDLVASSRKFGFEKHILGYPYHTIDGGDLELKRELARIYLDTKPDISFIHQAADLWPDHVACSKAGQDAVLFAHGLSGNLKAPQCPLVYSYVVTPIQTTRFEPDSFFDVADVMPRYMELINETVAAYHRTTIETEVIHELKSTGSTQPVRMGRIAMSRLAYCVQHGHCAGCDYAVGVKNIWGGRRRDFTSLLK